MRGAISQLTNTPSWGGSQLKHRDNYTLLSISQMFKIASIKPVFEYFPETARVIPHPHSLSR